jgi:nucleoside-diphosphate-sugar epimerase
MDVMVTGYNGFVGRNFSDYVAKHHKKFDKNHIDIVCPTYDKVYGWVADGYVGDITAFVHMAAKIKGSDWELLDFNIASTTRAITKCLPNRHLIYIGANYDKKNAYKVSKDVGAFMVKSATENLGLPSTILYLPRVFGPNCKPFYNSFTSTLIYLAAKNQPYDHLVKDEGEIFELIHVKDVCKKIIEAIKHPPENGKCHEWRVGGKSVFLRDIIQMIRGKMTTHDLFEEIQQTLEWYKNNEPPKA